MTDDHREKVVEAALADGNVAEGAGEEYAEMLVRRVLKAAEPHLRRAHFEEANHQIKALRVYNDEEIAARRGPLEGWVRIDDVLAALDKAQELLEGERGKS